MGLSFLPENVKLALSHLNLNFLSEIRLRRGKPVIIEYSGEYKYLGNMGLASTESDRVFSEDIASVLNSATGGCIYGYTEQMKSGFITVEHGVRIGIAGEYVTENGAENTVKNITSLNIRVPHDVIGCSDFIFKALFCGGLYSTLIFSKPGFGKTTILRDIARTLSKQCERNVLIFDERGEIAAMDCFGDGFDLGAVDVIRSHNKLSAIQSAIRAMKPDVIITDELYGENDDKAAKYAVDCGITVIASSHIIDKTRLKAMPFEYFVELKKLNGQMEIYDKNFNSYSISGINNACGSVFVGK